MVVVTALASEIVIPARFHPEETTAFCLQKGISVIFGVPTMFAAIANAKASQGADWSQLRYCVGGGAPLPAEVSSMFQRVTRCRLLQGYGLSESASGVCFSPPSKDTPDGSAGFALAGSRIEIRSINDPSKVVLRGEVGEICAAGPQIMQGYWQQKDKTDEVMIGDLLRTGDSGYIDANGAVFVVDRLKELIIASGYNVYPRLVEKALYTHPSIREAAVIGSPDSYRGETVKAVVSLHPDTSLDLKSLQLFLKEKLSPIEIPKLLQILEELPKTAIGKISKIDLKSSSDSVF